MEPGPSTLRHSRRQISRTQRTMDEPEKSVVTNADSAVDPLRLPEPISDRLRNRTPRNNLANIDNDSDPDDDKPLHLMVSESPVRGRPSRNSSRLSDEAVTPSSSNLATFSVRSARIQKRPYYNEDTDEEEAQQPKRLATQNAQSGR